MRSSRTQKDMILTRSSCDRKVLEDLELKNGKM